MTDKRIATIRTSTLRIRQLLREINDCSTRYFLQPAGAGIDILDAESAEITWFKIKPSKELWIWQDFREASLSKSGVATPHYTPDLATALENVLGLIIAEDIFHGEEF